MFLRRVFSCLFMVTVFTRAIGAPSLQLYTPDGVKEIEKHSSHHTKHHLGLYRTSALSQKDGYYSLLLLAEPPTLEQREKLRKQFGLILLQPHSRPSNHAAYHVKHLSNREELRNELAQKYPDFFNLISISGSEKISSVLKPSKPTPTGALDVDTGSTWAIVVAYPDVSSAELGDVVSKYGNVVGKPANGVCLVEASLDSIEQMANIPLVLSIAEWDTTFRPCMDQARKQTGVESLQESFYDLEAFPFPPTNDMEYSEDNINTGDDVVIGIYDGGLVDTAVLDFKVVNSGGDTISRETASAFYRSPKRLPEGHPTMVAGLTLANGWNSRYFGEPDYNWRGNAPKSNFITHHHRTHFHENEGDVNNYSIAISYLVEEYNSRDHTADNMVYNHNGGSNIAVFAAANAGYDKCYGKGIGFYSVENRSKNPIIVGGSFIDTALHWDDASMGPLRDGRIKPEIVAPASGMALVRRYSDDTLQVEIDFLEIRNKNGAQVRRDFDPGDPVWTGAKGSSIKNFGSALCADLFVADSTAHSEPDGYPLIDYATNPWTTDSTDTLIMAYRFSSAKSNSPSNRTNVQSLLVLDHPGKNKSSWVWLNMKLNSSTDTLRVCLREGVGETNPYTGRSDPKSQYGYIPTDGIQVEKFHLWVINFEGMPTLWMEHAPLSHGYHTGTSLAAPQVTGIVALMLQHYYDTYLDTAGLTIADDAFWNSTAKGILIHTATDLIQEEPYPFARPNPDFEHHGDTCGPVYYAGPDFSTGWGLVNAEKAVEYTSRDRFIEDSVAHREKKAYTLDLSTSGPTRVTLTWDDPPQAMNTPDTVAALINDLDMYVIGPDGFNMYLPWTLDPLPRADTIPHDGIDPIRKADIPSAKPGIDKINNVEVVDIPHAPAGTYSVVVTGANVLGGTMSGQQHFSLVADAALSEDTLLGGNSTTHMEWDYDIEDYVLTGISWIDTTATPPDTHYYTAEIPNVTSNYQPPALFRGDSVLLFTTFGECALKAVAAKPNSTAGYRKGQTLWSQQLGPKGAKIYSPPAVANDTTIFVASTGALYRIIADNVSATVTDSFVIDTSELEILIAPTVDTAAGNVYIGTLTDTLYAFPINGPFTPKNKVYIGVSSNENRMGRGFSRPIAIVDKNLYAITDRTCLIAFDENLNELWRDSLSDKSFENVSGAAISGGKVYVLGTQEDTGFVFSFSAEAGEPQYPDRKPVSAPRLYCPRGGPSVHNGTVYAIAEYFDTVDMYLEETHDTILAVDQLGAIERLYSHPGFNHATQPILGHFTEPGSPGMSSMRLYVSATTGGSDLVMVLDPSNPSSAQYIPTTFFASGATISKDSTLFLTGGNNIAAYHVQSDGMVSSWPCLRGNAQASGSRYNDHPDLETVPVGRTQNASGGWDAEYQTYRIRSVALGPDEHEDDLAFAYNYLAGDFIFEATISLIEPLSTSALAGIMARTELSATSSRMGVLGSAVSSGYMILKEDSGVTSGQNVEATAESLLGVKLRISRVGQYVLAWIENGDGGFVQVGYWELPVSTQGLYVGLVQASGDSLSLGTATFKVQPVRFGRESDLVPTTVSIVPFCDGTHKAYFGYHSFSDSAIYLAEGHDNQLLGSVLDSEDIPTQFLPGYHPNVFSAKIEDDTSVTWQLNGVSAPTKHFAGLAACAEEYRSDLHAKISPVLEWVSNNCDGTYTAHFGYYNRNSMPVVVDISQSNKITGAITEGKNQGQPVVFLPGRHRNLFRVRFQGAHVVWTLTRKTATGGAEAADPCN